MRTPLLLPLLASALVAQTPLPAPAPAFLPNQGQWPGHVHAMVQHGVLTTWLTATGFTTRVAVNAAPVDPRGNDGPYTVPFDTRAAVVHVTFAGGNAPTAEFGARLPGVTGMFVGNDPAAWREALPHHASCTLRSVWPGVDVAFGVRDGHVAYDLHLAPHAAAEAIVLQVEGAERLRLAADGALELDLGFGTLRHGRPVAWQPAADGSRRAIAARFALRSAHEVGFATDGRDPSLPLVIDPSLVWTRLLGGNGNDGIAFRQVLDRDAAGNLVVCGYTGSATFPPGPAQGTWDGFVASYSATGALVWSSLIGGSMPGDEWLRACRWDDSGGVFFGGSSSAPNYPTTAGCLQPTLQGPFGLSQYGDMVVGRLVPAGGGVSLTWSTFLGGTGIEQLNGLAVLAGGRVAVTGWSNSAMWTHPGAAQPASVGPFNSYTAILDPNQAGAAQRTHATWWGGSGNDDTPGCVVTDASGLLVVGGYTTSINIATTANALQPTNQGAYDGYLVAFDPSLSAAFYCSYLGGPGNDQANDVVIDTSGRWVIGNWTGGFAAPIQFPGCSFQSSVTAVDHGYALVLDPWQPAAQQVVWGTYLGTNLRTGVNGVAVDRAGRITVTGSVETLSGSVATTFPVTAWCQQPTPANGPGGTAGHWDAFVARFDPHRCGADQLVYSTFLGGTGFDYGYDLVLDDRDRPIVAGITSSTVFPVGGSPRPGGPQDIFVCHMDLLPTVADRFGAASPTCSEVHMDAYYLVTAAGLDLTLTCSDAPTPSLGLLLIGVPDVTGIPIPGLGITSHLSFASPPSIVGTLVSDPTGHASLRVVVPATVPFQLAVQTVWLGICAGMLASDALQL